MKMDRPAGVCVNASGTLEYVDPAAATQDWQFYRARQPE
jgi:hypothetical protein